MDVQADTGGLRRDPSATAVVQRVPAGDQGQLFNDAYPTYADTDQLPAVRGGARPARSATSYILRVAVVLLALAVLAAGAVLGLVKAGVIDKKNGSTTSGTTAAPAHHVTTTPTTPLATQTSTGNGTATYTVDIAAYAVTVTTSTGRSWVSLGGTGQRPQYEGILAAGSSQKEILIGASTVSVGAGGTTVVVSSNHRSTTLTPPTAPFTYQFVIKKS